MIRAPDKPAIHLQACVLPPIPPMPSHSIDPVIAIATAPGRGAVGIVRLSGARLHGFAHHLLGKALQPRMATYLPFPDAQQQAIDHGLALYFPAPHSYTGEDVLELQAHGGPVVLQLLLARCLQAASESNPATGQAWLPGLRLAEPGEFTQRAFLNDKMDLAQAEAVADLIDASTESAARSASLSLSGAFSAEIHTLLEQLIHLRMLVEATLDFPEEDVDFLEAANAQGQIHTLQTQLQTVLQRARQGALLREGIHIVIAGQPNAGKSSLLNALAGAELAIVTPIAGTTRDKVQQTIQIEGIPLHIIDTAGLRHSDDVVEQIGVERAWQEIAKADAILFLHDLSRQHDSSYQQADADIAARLYQQADARPPIIHVWNKLDLIAAPAISTEDPTQAPPLLCISAQTHQGLDALRQQLLQIAGWQAMPEGVFAARTRHLQALHEVAQHLHNANDHLQSPLPALDLLAEELRLGQIALGQITGEFTPDDLLGVIFSKFCIGK